MIDSTFWEKHDWQHILLKNMIGSTFWLKQIIDSTFWEKHDWQQILEKIYNWQQILWKT